MTGFSTASSRRRLGKALTDRHSTGTASPLGVNAIGAWSSTTGLAEAGRRAVIALLDAGLSVSLVDFDVHAPVNAARLPSRLATLPRRRGHAIDLCMVNVSEMSLLDESVLRPAGRRNYLIASWFWELPTFPPAIAAQIPRVDEIWVASRFVAQAIRPHTAAPIVAIPAVVEASPDEHLTRASFGLPEARCIFLATLDANSTFARKNPLGVVAAYRKAFTRQERKSATTLAVKCLNLSQHPEARATLASELDSVNGILLERDLTASAMSALLALCDVYVSLHRAEGFGLGMAESMYLGRPVIATAYSGNVDFMTPLNSFPVPYQLEPVRVGDLRFTPSMLSVYTPGSLWAEPDLDVAAHWMRRLYARPDLGARAGRLAARTIRVGHSAAAAGQAMRRRLEAIAADGSLA